MGRRGKRMEDGQGPPETEASSAFRHKADKVARVRIMERMMSLNMSFYCQDY